MSNQLERLSEKKLLGLAFVPICKLQETNYQSATLFNAVAAFQSNSDSEGDADDDDHSRFVIELTNAGVTKLFFTKGQIVIKTDDCRPNFNFVP